MSMRKKQVVYKVVYKTFGNRMWSVNASRGDSYKGRTLPLPDCVKLEYVIGKKTIPIYGKLFVFNDIEDALWYARNQGQYSHKVLKGYASNVEKADFLHVLSEDGFRDCSNVGKFWEAPKDVTSVYTWRIPSQTFLCDSFLPVEVVR